MTTTATTATIKVMRDAGYSQSQRVGPVLEAWSPFTGSRSRLGSGSGFGALDSCKNYAPNDFDSSRCCRQKVSL